MGWDDYPQLGLLCFNHTSPGLREIIWTNQAKKQLNNFHLKLVDTGKDIVSHVYDKQNSEADESDSTPTPFFCRKWHGSTYVVWSTQTEDIWRKTKEVWNRIESDFFQHEHGPAMLWKTDGSLVLIRPWSLGMCMYIFWSFFFWKFLEANTVNRIKASHIKGFFEVSQDQPQSS